MITISPSNNRYKMKFSNPGSGWRGYSVEARSIDEVHTLLDHHYARPHDQANCQFCKKEREESAKQARKRTK